MLPFILVVAVLAVVAVLVAKLVFGILGGLFALALILVKIGIALAIVYFVLSLISPEHARRLRVAVLGQE